MADWGTEERKLMAARNITKVSDDNTHLRAEVERLEGELEALKGAGLDDLQAEAQRDQAQARAERLEAQRDTQERCRAELQAAAEDAFEDYAPDSETNYSALELMRIGGQALAEAKARVKELEAEKKKDALAYMAAVAQTDEWQTSAETELDRMRPVVEAALEWMDSRSLGATHLREAVCAYNSGQVSGSGDAAIRKDAVTASSEARVVSTPQPEAGRQEEEVHPILQDIAKNVREVHEYGEKMRQQRAGRQAALNDLKAAAAKLDAIDGGSVFEEFAAWYVSEERWKGGKGGV